MAEDRDRTSRYSNSPKGAKKHDTPAAENEAAKAEAEKTAGGTSAPHADNPGKVGKQGSDPGPEGGEDATWGVVASRHSREHSDMLKRHHEELTATHERHASEAKTLHKRHHDEMRDTATASAEAARTAGSPKELGEAKSEGKAGSSA